MSIIVFRFDTGCVIGVLGSLLMKELLGLRQGGFDGLPKLSCFVSHFHFMRCLGVFLTHLAYPSFSEVHCLDELIAHSLFVFTTPMRLGLRTFSVVCMQLILCDTELLTVFRLQMRDSCLMQGFGFRPNGCICQISWVRSVRSGFGCFKVLKKNKGFFTQT